MFFSENFCSKGFDDRSLLPCVGWEPSFAAGLLEEGNAVPMMLNRDLRKQEPAAEWGADEEAVASDLNGIGRDRFGRRKNAEFNLQIPRFFKRYGMKPRVFESGSPGSLRHRAIDGTDWQNVTDTSA